MVFEFTVNSYVSDDGLTLVFCAATGLDGQVASSTSRCIYTVYLQKCNNISKIM